MTHITAALTKTVKVQMQYLLGLLAHTEVATSSVTLQFKRGVEVRLHFQVGYKGGTWRVECTTQAEVRRLGADGTYTGDFLNPCKEWLVGASASRVSNVYAQDVSRVVADHL